MVRRLPKYLTLSLELLSDGLEWISSQELGEALGLTSSTVRQDLSHLDISGISRRGYRVEALAEVLRHELGTDLKRRAIIIGAGHLGCALACHREFSEHGFDICALLDNDPELAGRKVGGLTVQPMDTLERLADIWTLDVGILAVPASVAQDVADLLISVGVRSLLNLAGSHIHAPDSVPVVDARILESLQELAHALKQEEQETALKQAAQDSFSNPK